MGSIQVFANALNVSEKELFKMMEQGTIVSAEVLPKVAKEFAKAARGGGALAQALKTVRVQQGKFLTQSQKAQDTIFRGGFGEGLASFYRDMVEILKDIEPALKVLGKAFKFLFKTIASSISILSAPIRVISDVIDAFVDLKGTTESLVGNSLPKLVSMGLMLLTPWGKLLVLFTAIKATLEEVFALTTKGVIGQVERDLGRDIGFDLMDKSSPTTGKSNSKTKDPEGFWDNLTHGYSNYNPVIAGADLLWNSIGNMSKNAGTPIIINQQPTIDEYGSVHIDNSIERSIVNGQAQR